MKTTLSINSAKLRNLNDYESMLATSTCNVGMCLSIPAHCHDDESIEFRLRLAWSKCVAERRMLQVRLEPRVDDNIGPLGQQRYSLAPIEEVDKDGLFVVHHLGDDNDDISANLLVDLQRIGTAALDISKASYYASCSIVQETNNNNDDGMILVQVVLSLCHALSDGPGALRVAQSFLQHLGNITSDGVESASCSGPLSELQPLTDLQALILGNDYASDEEPKLVFDGQDEFTAALAIKPTGMVGDAHVLAPEGLQNIATDVGFGGPSVIDCVHFSLTAEETTALRRACRANGATVQGAITAAALTTRVTLLGLDLPVLAAVQVPVNTRSLASVNDNECLCGSAGVWLTTRINRDQDLVELARRLTQSVRAALQDDDASQPREWLRRLLHSPATLPPYSLMVSSIGVAPIEKIYGNVEVSRLLFFGGALRTDKPSQAQATMIHAITFRDELNCVLNFTSPGVAKSFMEDTSRRIKASLASMSREHDDSLEASTTTRDK